MRLRKISCGLWLVAVGVLTQIAFGGDESPSSATPMPAQQVFANLQANAPVRCLLRMVAYDPAHPELRIDHLKMLGSPTEDFTFVADYEELRGYTASEAAHKAGVPVQEGQGVSAVLFPIDRHTIFPASVRGMLQVVQQIDMRRAAESGYRAAPLDVLLTDAERTNLAAFDLKSWDWDNYRDHFGGFAHAFSMLRSKDASAVGHIERIGPGWCEPGCSKLLTSRKPSEENSMMLKLPAGETFEIKNLGVRIFLIRNLPIASLSCRVLIDFSNPTEERIPLDLPKPE